MHPSGEFHKFHFTTLEAPDFLIRKADLKPIQCQSMKDQRDWEFQVYLFTMDNFNTMSQIHVGFLV